MIFWKEWRRLRARFLFLCGFYGLTVLLLDLRSFVGLQWFGSIPIALVGWATALLLVPAILGMDAYAGERDEGTEVFLFSKPVGTGRIVLAKVGLRVLMTAVIVGGTLAILLIRIGGAVPSLYLGTRPYVIWFLVLSIVAGELFVLMATITVSLRAPYQSTALIIGGALGAAVAAYPVVSSLVPIEALQASWGSFWLLVLLLALIGALAGYGFQHQEAGRSRS